MSNIQTISNQPFVCSLAPFPPSPLHPCLYNITYFHSLILINVCDNFLERTQWGPSGARPGRELFMIPLGLGTHGGANSLVPLLPVSPCEPDTTIRIALGKRHAEKCAMRETLSEGF